MSGGESEVEDMLATPPPSPDDDSDPSKSVSVNRYSIKHIAVMCYEKVSLLVSFIGSKHINGKTFIDWWKTCHFS